MFNSVEYIRSVCRQRKIPISQIEKDCGFGNGYLNPKKLKKLPYDRAVAAANYLDIPVNTILTGEEEQKENPTSKKTGEVDELTKKLLDIAYNGTKEQKEYILDFYETIKRREKG